MAPGVQRSRMGIFRLNSPAHLDDVAELYNGRARRHRDEASGVPGTPLRKVKDADGNEHGSDGRFGSGSGAKADNAPAKPAKTPKISKPLHAMIEKGLKDGTIAFGGKGACESCSSQPDVLDGARQAHQARYTRPHSGDPKDVGYCGTHLLSEITGKERRWNGDKFVVVTKPKDKAAAAQGPKTPTKGESKRQEIAVRDKARKDAKRALPFKVTMIADDASREHCRKEHGFAPFMDDRDKCNAVTRNIF